MRISNLFAIALLASGIGILPSNFARAQQSEFDEERVVAPDEAFLQLKLDRDAQKVVDGINVLTVELYQRMRPKTGNVAISPASISTAFGLVYAGAKRDTAKEIAATLHYPAVKDFHAGLGSVLDSMQIDRTGRKVAVNNSIWVQDGLKLVPDYEDILTRFYRAGLNRVDYEADPDAARLKINAWVEDKTNNRIKNLLGPPQVDDSTRNILVNTIYLKSEWAESFPRTNTKDGDFSQLSGKKTKRPLMQQRNVYGYAESKDAQLISLPYRGGEMDMVVMLPKKRSGFAKFESSLTPSALAGLLRQLDESAYADTILTLPKFKIENRYDEVVATLKAMGMQTPFSDYADFSGVSLQEPLKISAVIHQTFVEVEEKGTEAAAATAVVQVVVVAARRGPPPPPPKIFRADHPFIFLIRDRRTKAILFIGRYVGD